MIRQQALVYAMLALACIAGCNKARLGRGTGKSQSPDSLSASSSAAQPDTAAAGSASTAPDSVTEQSTGLSAASKLMIRACDNYLAVKPGSEKAPEVLSIKAGTYYNSGLYAKSREVYRSVIEEYPEDPFAVEAVKMVAQSFYEDKEFDKAQEWYRKLGKVAQGGGDRKEAEERTAESIFRMAQTYEEQQRYKDAAEQFERVALEFPEVRIADVALFNAGLAYERQTRWSHAILMYQRLTKRYLSSNLLPKAIFRSGKCFEKLFQWDQAGQTYLRVVARFPKSELAPAALYNAGVCFENADKLIEAAAAFEKLVELYPNSDDAADVLFKAGEIYGKLKDWESVTRVNKEFARRFGNDIDRVVQAQCMVGVALYMQGNESEAIERLRQAIGTYERLKSPSTVNRYYAAKAKFTIAEIHHQRMNAVELRQPGSVYRRLLKDKSELLDQAIAAYSGVLEYGISEWTTRGVFQVGRVYEDFARGISRQARPTGMGLEERLALELGIAQAVEEYFVDKAMHYHEQNVKLGIKEEIENKYILQSRTKLIFLPFASGKNYLTLVEIAQSATERDGLTGFALIADKLETLQKIAPFQERAIELFLTCLKKGATYEEYNEFYEQASKLITGIGFTVGETYSELVTIARGAPIPEGFDDYERFVYKTKLLQQIQNYEDQAIGNYLKTAKIAEAYAISDEYVTKSKERLAKIVFNRGRCYDLLGTTAFTHPPFPDGVGEAEQEEYMARFEEIGLRFQDQAFQLYRSVLDYAEQGFAQGDFVNHAYVRLYQHFPEEYGVKQEKIEPKTLSSGPQWKCTTDSAEDWTKLDFNDRSWHKVRKGITTPGVAVAGFPGKIPVPMWYGTAGGKDYDPAHRLFFRRTFYNRATPHEADLYVAATGHFDVYLNGAPLPDNDTVRGQWTEARQWDLLGKLRNGKNVLAIRARAAADTAFGVFPFVRLMVAKAEYLPQPPGFDQPFSREVVAEGTYQFPFIKNFSSVMTNARGNEDAEH